MEYGIKYTVVSLSLERLGKEREECKECRERGNEDEAG